MTERISLTLHNAQDMAMVERATRWLKAMLIAGHKMRLEAGKATRSSEQNAAMWAMLTDISRQLEWPVNGKMAKLDPEDWKHIISGGLTREQRIAQGINGGWVVLGQRTSKMTKAEMSELLELIQAFGAQHGVKFSAPDYREAA